MNITGVLFMIRLTPSQKRLLYKKVHFSKSLAWSRLRGYELIRDPKDNNLYYVKDGQEKYYGRPTENPKTWKNYFNRTLEEKNQKTGFVANISYLYLNETEYPSNRFFRNDEITNCSSCVKRTCNNYVLVAEIFTKNDFFSQQVPLDCIKEYEEFCNGKETEKILNKIEEINNKEAIPNTITYNSDGTILIEGTDFYLDSDLTIQPRQHGLLLDIKNRQIKFLSEKKDEWFDITDAEFQNIILGLKGTIKEEYGFEPTVVYGATNFDKLVNFTNYPFAPEINEFSKIMEKNFPAKIIKNHPNGVKSFIEYCGIPYTPAVNRIFLQGHRKFAQLLGIWGFGYRNFKNIEEIMKIDKEMFFAEAAFKYGKISSFIEDKKRRTGFHFVNINFPLAKINLITKICDEKSSIKLLSEIFEKGVKWWDSFHSSLFLFSSLDLPDTYTYLCKLYEENAVSTDIIKKIVDEGFTKYNHDMLMNLWNELHPDGIENIKIQYSEKERKLEYESNGFKFKLPNDTRKLLEIGAKMNICVGHLYREKAAKKQCTIIYVKRDSKYVMCMELKEIKGKFYIVQVSEFSNHKVQGINMEVLNEWQRINRIDWVVSNL